jgi:hypothetical protein
LDLGTIPFGSSGSGTFEIRNEGDDPIRILGIGPSGCDCATLALTLPDRLGSPKVRPEYRGMNLDLQPGEMATLEIVLDTSRYREPVTWKSGRIPLILEGQTPASLDYAADIWTPFWVEPWSIPFGNVGIRAQASGFVVVRAQEAKEFTPLSPPEVDGWAITTSRVLDTETCTWKIQVTAPEELPEGPFQQEFSFKTDLQNAPTLKFFARGVAHPDIAHSPKRILIRPSVGETESALSIRALSENLELQTPELQLEEPIPDLDVQLETVQVGKLFRVHFNYSGPDPTETIQSTLIINTHDSEIPSIRVPVSVLPKIPSPPR